MDSPVHVPATETTPFWTQEKHVHFLNSLEASFVRTMLDSNHHRLLRLDRHLPDTSESTVDSKPHHRSRRRTRKHHAPSDSMGRKARRTRKRSSSSCNSSQDQVVPQVQIEREGAACNNSDDRKAAAAENSTSL